MTLKNRPPLYQPKHSPKLKKSTLIDLIEKEEKINKNKVENSKKSQTRKKSLEK